MTVEEAIRTALDLERGVRDRYQEFASAATGAAAHSFFELMGREEQGHVDFLEDRLERWKRTGELSPEGLATAVPRRDWLERGDEALAPADALPERRATREHLFTALELEQRISELYRRLVTEVQHPAAGRLFQRFLEIEDGHTALVQAEIDFETRTGYFFDVQEFTLDG